MIRDETETDWLLVTHPDHARVAGLFADAWGNKRFEKPPLYPSLRYAVYHHDDGWLERDSLPSLTPAGRPEAFSRNLVGAYSAFEEIDLPAYLGVRSRATTVVAETDPLAAVFVSMHTCNLLTEQADLDSIRPEHRQAHADFIASQRAWQQVTAQRLRIAQTDLQRGFEFLQCADNLSLIVCSGYALPRPLRHTHVDSSGVRHSFNCVPFANAIYEIDPWPLHGPFLDLEVPFRRVPKSAATDFASFRSAFANAALERRNIRLVPKAPRA